MLKCELCGKAATTEKHHLFSQSKLNRKLYGKLIDDARNIINLCYDCHHCKPIPKFSEIEFCEMLKIHPRSKIAKAIWGRM